MIGASAGGFEAIQQLVASLPAGLQASIFIVWHMSPNVRGILPEVLNRKGAIPATHAINMEEIRPGHIYVAPPDYHLLIEKDRVRISRGPKENRFRPAVDPLFRSAAFAYGPRVIGVILSGALDDGTAGLWAIKAYGGLAVVQDPADAAVSAMPQNAMQAVHVDYKAPIAEMAALLARLAGEEVPDGNGHDKGNMDRRTEMEVSVAMENESIKFNLLNEGRLTPYTCPECHGVLAAFSEGARMRFRCHTGHAFSADSLLATITENIEESLWSAIRSIQESERLLNHMGDHFAEINQPKLAAMYFKKAKEAASRAHIVRQAVLNHEHLTTESIRQQAISS